MQPSVAFVLYAYNEEPFIREAIESAFAQTYSPLEIVLSDDGSTDQTYAIMEEMAAAYRGPHTIILNRNEKNIGIGSQLNAAWHKSRGELFVLANGDDLSMPYRVDRVVHEWVSHGKTAAAIWSELAIVGPDGRDTGRIMRAKRDFRDIPKATRDRFGGPVAAALAIRRDCFDQFGELMGHLIIEDGPLNMRATLLGKWLFIDEPLVKYRVHAENISQAYHVEEFETWRNRHRTKTLWQRREGQMAFVQMLVDLYSPATARMDPTSIRSARAEAAWQLSRDQLLESYYSKEWAPPLSDWWKAWARWTTELVKVTAKAAMPWIERRNERWHFESANRAASMQEKERLSSEGKTDA